MLGSVVLGIMNNSLTCAFMWAAEAKARVQRHEGLDEPFDVHVHMPTYDSFLQLRMEEEQYTLFLDKFVRQVVGARKFDKLSVDMPLPAYAKVSDEAFALLIYENQEERWKLMIEHGTTKIDKAAKYTDGGKSTKETGRSRKARGWDNKGIKRFNELCQMVQTDRGGNHAQGFHERYQGYRKSLRDVLRGNKARTRKVNTYLNDAEVVDSVFHEMEDGLVGIQAPNPVTTPRAPDANHGDSTRVYMA